MINLCRQQLRAGLGNERKESARCECTAGVSAADGRFGRKAPPWVGFTEVQPAGATVLTEFDAADDGVEGPIFDAEHVAVLE